MIDVLIFDRLINVDTVPNSPNTLPSPACEIQWAKILDWVCPNETRLISDHCCRFWHGVVGSLSGERCEPQNWTWKPSYRERFCHVSMTYKLQQSLTIRKTGFEFKIFFASSAQCTLAVWRVASSWSLKCTGSAWTEIPYTVHKKKWHPNASMIGQRHALVTSSKDSQRQLNTQGILYYGSRAPRLWKLDVPSSWKVTHLELVLPAYRIRNILRLNILDWIEYNPERFFTNGFCNISLTPKNNFNWEGSGLHNEAFIQDPKLTSANMSPSSVLLLLPDGKNPKKYRKGKDSSRHDGIVTQERLNK